MTPCANTSSGLAYDRVDPGAMFGLDGARWIGRCKRCGATHKLEGRLTTAHASSPPRHDYVIVTGDGAAYLTGAQGTDLSTVVVRCNDHWCRLCLVREGTKKSKHECGARCTNATGPNCDCRCRGKNHGKNC